MMSKASLAGDRGLRSPHHHIADKAGIGTPAPGAGPIRILDFCSAF
jgi:hypothetical protein